MKSKIVLAGLILLVVMSCRKKASDDYNYYKPYVNDSVAIVDSVKPTVAVPAKVAAPEPEPQVKGVDLNDNYFIVVASFTVEEYAIGRKKDLISQGYKPDIFMLNEDGWYKLAVESYSGYSEAKEALSKVRNRGGIFGTAVIVAKKSK
ncbi:MAG: SPOR domain-containing protein [Prolixibacteraceae bacterium]